MKKHASFYFFLLLFIAVITFYSGCNNGNLSEPDSSNENSIIGKKVPSEYSDLITNRKMLLDKFFKEIKDAKKRVREKWAEKGKNMLQKTQEMAPADQEALELATAITPSASSYVISAYGVDLNQYFEQGDPNIALTGLLIAYVESDLNNGIRYEIDGELISSIVENSEFYKLLTSDLNKVSYVLLRPKWVECMAEASGVAAFVDILYAGGAATLSVVGVIKLAGKVLAKHLTFIGAAVAIADFIYCMYE